MQFICLIALISGVAAAATVGPWCWTDAQLRGDPGPRRFLSMPRMPYRGGSQIPLSSTPAIPLISCETIDHRSSLFPETAG
jgi:hypothetical protein